MNFGMNHALGAELIMIAEEVAEGRCLPYENMQYTCQRLCTLASLAGISTRNLEAETQHVVQLSTIYITMNK